VETTTIERTGLLTDAEHEGVEIARTHARAFAERAGRHDRENTFPFEDFDDMRESGYLALPVPAELGGRGVSLLGLCAAQDELAQGAPATALGVNMHLFTVGLVAELYREEPEERTELFLRTVAEGQMIVAASISEAETSGNNFRHAATRAERVDGGYRITGRKIFASISPVMNGYTSHAVYEDPERGPLLVHFLVARDAPGLEVVETWDAMGMRPTGSNDIVLDGVVVPDELVIAERPAGVLDEFAINSHKWFAVTFGAVYTGVAAGAMEFAKAYARDRIRKPYDRSMAHFPSIQFLVAEMETRIAASRALVWQTAHELGQRPATTAREFGRALTAKYVAADNAVAVVDRAMSVTGGSGYLKKSPLERLYSDVRGAKVHPPSHYDALEIIGKAALDVPLDAEPRFG
jgi:alkylation response protein AidB-like acyl-CoA dehydrogenase